MPKGSKEKGQNPVDMSDMELKARGFDLEQRIKFEKLKYEKTIEPYQSDFNLIMGILRQREEAKNAKNEDTDTKKDSAD